MNREVESESNRRLQSLLTAYREVCEVPEPGVNFVPEIWRRIEARQSVGIFFNRLARGFVATAIALSLILGAFVMLPSQQNSAFYSGSYVEALADDQPSGAEAFMEPVHLDQAEPGMDRN